MAHPWHHALLSARRHGGRPEDYLDIHAWFDYTKSHIPDCRHRLFLHNSWGIFVAERILGATFTRISDGQTVPLRPLLERHVQEDFGQIPTLAACLEQIAPESEEGALTIYAQCQASVQTWGGTWTDYQPIHHFLDWPREHMADGRQRRVFHNTWGLAMIQQAFGLAYQRPSDGVALDVQAVAEQHIRLECEGSIPTLEACLDGIVLQRWMCLRAMPIRISLSE